MYNCKGTSIPSLCILQSGADCRIILKYQVTTRLEVRVSIPHTSILMEVTLYNKSPQAFFHFGLVIRTASVKAAQRQNFLHYVSHATERCIVRTLDKIPIKYRSATHC